ncbi:FadR/GntR family transcriptional regulator [Aquabacterium sp.]|uniref:FadR/GntR family transcriptional regulator n=1 Tax=Aquabacterium sp. TaxID=1872578 RepID=UPI002B998C9F|nr:FCD domain-containing protein [Aquabacterium sp.]HSW04940.1 FCD domain-containing protein [Aquabacterium sp.]
MANTEPQERFGRSLDMRSDEQQFRVPKTAELVARDLRSKIVRGELKEGDTLPAEGELVERYSVSRPTLREALRILESEALLTVTRGSRGGPRVHPPDPRLAARHFGLVLQNRGTTLADIFGARLLIEPSCVHLVASTARKAAGLRLAEIVEQERATLQSQDEMAFSRASARFHRSLIELTGNLPLILLMNMLTHIYESHIATSALAANVERFDSASRSRGLKTHEKLLALIQAGDADGAEAFWRKHLESIDKLIRENFAVDRAIDLLE